VLLLDFVNSQQLFESKKTKGNTILSASASASPEEESPTRFVVKEKSDRQIDCDRRQRHSQSLQPCRENYPNVVVVSVSRLMAIQVIMVVAVRRKITIPSKRMPN
jgi:hypothetical protein